MATALGSDMIQCLFVEDCLGFGYRLGFVNKSAVQSNATRIRMAYSRGRTFEIRNMRTIHDTKKRERDRRQRTQSGHRADTAQGAAELALSALCVSVCVDCFAAVDCAALAHIFYNKI